MSYPPTDRTRSVHQDQREQREKTAVAIAVERLPWVDAIGTRFGIERSAWRALTDAVFPNAKTTEGVILALSYCKARKLDVFKRLVHIVPIWSKEKRGYVETVWPGIGETRTTALRTGNYAGCDETKFGPDMERTWTMTGEDDAGRAVERAVTVTFPEWAQITVHRERGEKRYSVSGPRVYWLETYVTEKRNSPIPNEMWIKRPRGQLEKCAEAQALRRAFPEELGDEPTVDEIGGYSGLTIDEGGNVLDDTQQQSTPTAPPKPTAPPPTQVKKTAPPPPPRQETPPVVEVKRAEPEPTQEVSGGQTDDFQAWIIDEDGAETTVEPYGNAVRFANALATLCAGKSKGVVDDLLRNNEAAIGDASDANTIAAQIINAIAAKNGTPEDNQPPVDEGQPEEPAFSGPSVLAIPKTNRGADNWPSYIMDAQAELDACETAGEATAWVARNRATWERKNTQAEAAIERHYRVVMARFNSGGSRQD